MCICITHLDVGSVGLVFVPILTISYLCISTLYLLYLLHCYFILCPSTAAGLFCNKQISPTGINKVVSYLILSYERLERPKRTEIFAAKLYERCGRTTLCFFCGRTVSHSPKTHHLLASFSNSSA